MDLSKGKLKVLDLFSGIGGFSLGLDRTGGFETIAFCEIDPECQKVLNKHWPEVPLFVDVTTLSWKSSWDKIDVICGGFPCQDISVAGKQKGIKNGTRSGLWFEYKRLIGEIRPSYVIIENVAALRSNGLVTVLQDLWTLGYDAEWNIISARDIGACHLRERIWIIAYPNGQRIRVEPRGSSGKSGEDTGKLAHNGEKGTSSHSMRKGLEGSDVSSSSSTDREAELSDNGITGIGTKAPNTHYIRFGKPFASKEIKSQWWAEASASQRDWWEAQPRVSGIYDGIPSRPYESHRKQRIKQLGNSIVPGIAEVIGNQILEYEAIKCL